VDDEYLHGGLSLSSGCNLGRMWKTAAGVCIGILAALGVLALGAAVVIDQSNDDPPADISPEELDDALTVP
jgi:hypothetical protein